MIKKCVKKAVVVNDDAVQLRLISRILEKDGVEVSSCKSVQEAFAAMKDHTAPDIIVTDLHMPSIDGWRFCRLLRSPEYPEFNDVPILVVSATYSGEHAEEVNSTLGANGFLAAPFEAPVLLDNVRALLQGKTVLPLKKVLIVDDSLSVVNLIRNAFNAHGYTVFTALTGEEGLRLFHENQPDIAVLDYHLPDTTGDKLLKEIKQPGPLTVAVMITTDPTPELATRFIELGADGYARKPFDPEYLITLCENARRERALLRVEDILEDRTRQLRQSEERFRSLFKNIPEPVLVHDEKGVLLQVNETGAKQLECAIQDLVGNPLDSIVIPDCASLIPDNIRETFANGSNRFETTFITRSGKQIIAEVQECLIEYEGKKAILGVARNITERKMAEEEKNKLEKMLARAEKMEALGIMAGGVAHDLNNILTGIVSYPDLILLQLDNDDPMVEVIETIKASGKKAADIVQDLLTMARRGVRTTRVVNLNDTVSGYLNSPEFKSLKNKCRDIAFDTCFEPELLNIRGSELHLSKTLMNLVTNATEAMPNSGKVTISTANQYIDRPIKGYDDVQEGDYAVLTVADNGTGMDNKSLQRIFEPFYTKKVPGQGGTGIGMAVVWGTVKDHDGYIDVESREHEGTVFRLYFPVTREVKDRDKAGKTVVLEDCRGNGERILVVDDVEEQRIIASELLTRLGYEVTVVPSGEKAIEHVKTSPADLLVLDMIMEPGIDGLDTYRKILEIQPKQKAIIASGYAETERVRETQRLGAGVYLRKPYTLLSFGEAVKNELARNNPAGHN